MQSYFVSVIGPQLIIVTYGFFLQLLISYFVSVALGSLPGGMTKTFTCKGFESSYFAPFLSLLLLCSFPLTFTIGHGRTKRHPREFLGFQIWSSLLPLCSNPICPWQSGSMTPSNRLTNPLPIFACWFCGIWSPKCSGGSLIFQFREEPLCVPRWNHLLNQ